MNADQINKSYTKEYKSIHEACNAAGGDDKLALRRCEMRARALLAEPTIPLYHRIKTLLLLTSIVGMSSLASCVEDASFCLQEIIDDIDEASDFLDRAEVQWRAARDHEERYDNPAAEEALLEMSGMVAELRGLLAKEDAEGTDGAEEA